MTFPLAAGAVVGCVDTTVAAFVVVVALVFGLGLAFVDGWAVVVACVVIVADPPMLLGVWDELLPCFAGATYAA